MSRFLKGLFGGDSPGSDSLYDNPATSDQFHLLTASHHGVPSGATCLAYDPVQQLLAVGDAFGHIKVFGRPGVEYLLSNHRAAAIRLVFFHINKPVLVTICVESMITVWNLTERRSVTSQPCPAPVQSANFPPGGNFIYLGCRDGSVRLFNVAERTWSPYNIIREDVMGNIDPPPDKTRVVAVAPSPADANLLLIGFSGGAITLWNFKKHAAEQRFGKRIIRRLTTLAWHKDGRHFAAGHDDGEIVLWSTKDPSKPQQRLFRMESDGNAELGPRWPVRKLLWTSWSTRGKLTDGLFVIGGEFQGADPQPGVAVVLGPDHVNVRVLPVHTDEGMTDATLVHADPWPSQAEDPTTLFALTATGELCAFDLRHDGMHPLPLPASFQLQVCPITAMLYRPDAPGDLLLDLTTLGGAQSASTYWPLNGGRFPQKVPAGTPTLIVTGHADGSVRFWDATTPSVVLLYTLFAASLPQQQYRPSRVRITAMDVCTASRTFVCAFASGEVVAWDFAMVERSLPLSVTGVDALTLTGPPPVIDGAGISPDVVRKALERRKGSSVSAASRGGSTTSGASAKPPIGSAKHTVLTPTVRREKPEPMAPGYQPLLLVRCHDSPITQLCLVSGWDKLAIGDARGLVSLVDLEHCTVLMHRPFAVASDQASVTTLTMAEMPPIVPTQAVDAAAGSGGEDDELEGHLIIGMSTGTLSFVSLEDLMLRLSVRPKSASAVVRAVVVDSHGVPHPIVRRAWHSVTQPQASFLGGTSVRGQRSPDVQRYLLLSYARHIRGYHLPSWTRVVFYELPRTIVASSVVVMGRNRRNAVLCVVNEQGAVAVFSLLRMRHLVASDLDRVSVTPTSLARSVVARDGCVLVLSGTSELRRLHVLRLENKLNLPASLPLLHDADRSMPSRPAGFISSLMTSSDANLASLFTTGSLKGGTMRRGGSRSRRGSKGSTGSLGSKGSRREKKLAFQDQQQIEAQRKDLLVGSGSYSRTKAVAPKTKGKQQVDAVAGAKGAAGQAMAALADRGEKIELLHDKTAEMSAETEDFANTAEELVKALENKKWYQL